MNNAPVDARLRPTRRLLLTLIRVKSGGALNARAERLDIRAQLRGWPEAVTEQLLGRLLEHAELLDRGFHIHHQERRHMPRVQTRLARANGCDQPDSARESYPKTPAAGEQGCRVAAAGRKAGDASTQDPPPPACAGGMRGWWCEAKPRGRIDGYRCAQPILRDRPWRRGRGADAG